MDFFIFQQIHSSFNEIILYYVRNVSKLRIIYFFYGNNFQTGIATIHVWNEHENKRRNKHNWAFTPEKLGDFDMALFQ